MADTSIQHYTLVANTAKTVTLDKDYAEVEVVNVDGAAAVYFTVDGATPTIAGDNTQVLPATIASLQVSSPRRSGVTTTVVRLISAGIPKVSVRGIT
jgi:hypothetical protein